MGRKSDWGFTLIELLVVIAIIAMLLAIITPALKMAKEHSRRLVCTSNMKSLSYIVNVYATENDSELPVSKWLSNGTSGYVRIGWLNDVPYNVANDIRRQFTIDMLYCPSNSLLKKPGPELEQVYVNIFDPKVSPEDWEKATGGNVVSDYFWLLTFGHGTTGQSWRDTVFYTNNPSKPLFINHLKTEKNLSIRVLVTDVVGATPVAGQSEEKWDFTNIRDYKYRTNHVRSTKALGGNALYGDGSVRWTDFSKMAKNFTFADYHLWW